MLRSLALFILLCWLQAAAAHPDTVTIVAISSKTDMISGNIHGTEVTVLFKKRFPLRKGESGFQSYHFAVNVLDESGKPVSANNPVSRFSENGFVVSSNSTNDADIMQTGVGKFFIPYYALKLNEGPHNLQVRLQVMRFDSVKGKYDPHKVFLIGPTEKEFTINKPKTRTIKLYCSGVRVKDHNSKGNPWDFGSTGLPDLVYRVILESDNVADRLYSSTEMQNSTAAAWIDYTGPIIISVGDKITLGIYDNDTLYDDLIGQENLSIDELLDASSAAKELHFGYVDFCTVKAQEIK